jgi:hypothetical protein
MVDVEVLDAGVVLVVVVELVVVDAEEFDEFPAFPVPAVLLVPGVVLVPSFPGPAKASELRTKPFTRKMAITKRKSFFIIRLTIKCRKSSASFQTLFKK